MRAKKNKKILLTIVLIISTLLMLILLFLSKIVNNKRENSMQKMVALSDQNIISDDDNFVREEGNIISQEGDKYNIDISFSSDRCISEIEMCYIDGTEISDKKIIKQNSEIEDKRNITTIETMEKNKTYRYKVKFANGDEIYKDFKIKNAKITLGEAKRESDGTYSFPDFTIENPMHERLANIVIQFASETKSSDKLIMSQIENTTLTNNTTSILMDTNNIDTDTLQQGIRDKLRVSIASAKKRKVIINVGVENQNEYESTSTITIIQKDLLEVIKEGNDTVVLCDSLVQGIRDSVLDDGTYIFRINGKTSTEEEVKNYKVELINYKGDIKYSLENGEESKTIALGDESSEYKMLAVKYYNNLTIDKGVTLTASTSSENDKLCYKKGMYICVLGKLENNGVISMSARGTYNCEGENVYLWENNAGTYEYVPALGAEGGDAIGVSWTAQFNGNPGKSGSNRQTGGGGTGGGRNWSSSAFAGKGGRGTSYSGGAGSGAANSDGGGGWYARSNDGSSIGGAGSSGVVHSSNGSGYAQISLGGTGNPSGGYETYRSSIINYVQQHGTGGLLIVYCDELDNKNLICANGVQSSSAGTTKDRIDPGGASGGGSVNIFTKKIINNVSATATGGASVTLSTRSGAGGDGTVTVVTMK